MQWAALRDALVRRSGEWAELDESVGVHQAPRIRDAVLRPFAPANSFEAVVRNGRVYARHVGGA